MATNPFPTDTTGVVVNSAIDGIFKVAISTADAGLEAALISVVPEMAAPILSTLSQDTIDEIDNYIGNAIYKQLAQWVGFTIITTQDSSELSAEKSALNALEAAQAGGNANAIQSALVVFGQAAAASTHIDGAVPVSNV